MRTLDTKTKNILEAISKITAKGSAYQQEILPELLEYYATLFAFGPYEMRRRQISPKREMYQTFLRLKRGGYIKQNSRRAITITDKGQLVILTNVIKNKNRQQWDGKWRIFIFDVLEKARHERDFLRCYLKDFGAKELQKSVWVSPYNIEEEWELFLKLLNKTIEGDLRILTVEKVNPDDDLRKHFSLP